MIDYSLVESSRFNWKEYKTIQGSADYIPDALQLLLNSPIEEAQVHYWKIENHVVVQGGLFSAAEPALQVLIASLLNPRPRHTKIDVLELIFQMVSACVAEAGNLEYKELQKRVRACAIEGLWLFYRELSGEHAEAAKEILNILDENRLRYFLSEK